MKTRLELAHEWYMKHSRGVLHINSDIVDAWQYADAMLAENEKRTTTKEEWQPDWSVAPDGYDWFCVGSETNNGYFCNIEPKTFKDKYWFVGEDSIEIINHGYTGNWRNSLRKRPV